LSLKYYIHFSYFPNAYVLPISPSLIRSWEHDLVEYKWCTFSLRNFLHSLVPSSLFDVNKDSPRKPVCRHPQSMLWPWSDKRLFTCMRTSKINYCIVSFEVLRTTVTAANRICYNVMSCSLTRGSSTFRRTLLPSSSGQTEDGSSLPQRRSSANSANF
jgi:hypothetical protein